VGRDEQETVKKTDDYLMELQQTIASKKENVDNFLTPKKTVDVYSTTQNQFSNEVVKESRLSTVKNFIQAKILSKHKTVLEDI